MSLASGYLPSTFSSACLDIYAYVARGVCGGVKMLIRLLSLYVLLCSLTVLPASHVLLELKSPAVPFFVMFGRNFLYPDPFLCMAERPIGDETL